MIGPSRNASGPPSADMNTVNTGTCRGSSSTASRIAAATTSVFVTSGGTNNTMIASIPSQPARIPMARRNDSGDPSMVSTGLLRAASGGKNSARASRISPGRGGTVRPAASHASAARIPGPPPLVRMATRRPAGNGWFASRDATSKNSPSVSVRTTPAWRKRASTVTSDAPISAPV